MRRGAGTPHRRARAAGTSLDTAVYVHLEVDRRGTVGQPQRGGRLRAHRRVPGPSRRTVPAAGPETTLSSTNPAGSARSPPGAVEPDERAVAQCACDARVPGSSRAPSTDSSGTAPEPGPERPAPADSMAVTTPVSPCGSIRSPSGS